MEDSHARLIERLKFKTVEMSDPSLKAAYWLRSLSSAYQLRLDAQSGKYAPARQRPPHFIFRIDPTLNAAAHVERFEGGEIALVAVNEGSLHILVDVFHAMLSRSDLFVWVGDPKLEERQFDNVRISHEGIVADGDPHPSVPRFPARDPVRQRYAMMLTQITLDFLFAHEAAHVVAGHPLLAAKSYGRDPTMWARAPRNSPDESLVSKAMEMDADIEAGRRLAYYLANGSSMSLSDSELPASVGERFFCMSIAVAAYFLLIAPDSYGEDYWSASHPHPYSRMAYVYSGVADKFVELENEEWFVLWRAASKSAVETMERAWETIGMGTVPLGKYFEQENRVIAEVGVIHRRWRELVKEIRPFDLRQSN